MKFLKLLIKESLFWLGLMIIILDIIVVVVIFIPEGQWLLAIGLNIAIFFPVTGGFYHAVRSVNQKLKRR